MSDSTIGDMLVVPFGFLLVLIFFSVFAIWIGSLQSDLPVCSSPVEKTCYRYESSGGLLGGTNVYQTSCNSPHDYYINSSKDWYGCNPIYVRGYD